jgi:D-alanyl-D-alanine carboxypeptidase
MSVAVAASSDGTINWSEGSLDEPYGIASLSKIWASILLYDRMKQLAAHQDLEVHDLLAEPARAHIAYQDMRYTRMALRPDLRAPDDPLFYQPFGRDKARFCMPVEKDCLYSVRELFEAALFLSKNDAIQLLSDHFLASDDNRSFRRASQGLASALALEATRIGDPHGLCDGDNVSSARDLVTMCTHIIKEGYLDFFELFDVGQHAHTCQALYDDQRLKEAGIDIILAKTGTGNDRHGHDAATHLLAIARTEHGYKIALALSHEARFEVVTAMLLGV